ncbi:serine hydrolase domain-containing protein [Microbacterium sp. NPDC019599]|uniref:serine hydrolase domain-containing protein n=1 Tax=Microbacterium sp. NPDC019599 TaxID=3154690 RepID=UPI00340FA816
MRSHDDVAAFLSARFAEAVAARGVPGASIAVLVDGEVVEAAAGVLSTATHVDTTTDSVFQIGSITKVWTATLVMQLADEGLLDLDAPLRTYLPEFRLADDSAAGAITTRQLLSHQGGFEGDVFTDTGRGEDAIEKYVTAAIAELPQLFTPGELFSYNNAAYSVLGRLVEVLRGTTWSDALVEHIVRPLQLTHVAPSAYEAILFRAAVGHLGPGADGVETPAPMWALAKSNEPAGSMLAMTPRDLVGFAKMHLAGGVGPDGTRVLSEASARAMQEIQVDLPRLTGMGDAWGLGWEIIQKGEPVVIGHDGGTIGQSAFLRLVPELGIAVAMLTNGGDVMGLFDDVVAHLVKELAGVTLHGFPKPPAEPVAVDAGPLVGSYSNSTFDMLVTVDDEGLLWIDSTPKGILLEMGQQPERHQLVGYDVDTLITLQPAMKEMHLVYAFLGDDGAGRRKYLHYGRAIARND